VSDRLLESVPCNICGSLEAHVLQPAQYDIAALQDTDFARTFSSSSDERLNHQLVACAHCGLQYVSPRLRAESVLEGYATGSDEQFVSQDAFFFEDQQRSFFVVPKVPYIIYLVDPDKHKWFAFEPFYHPYIGEFIRRLNRTGVDGLLRWTQSTPLQLSRQDYFKEQYDPVSSAVVRPYPIEEIDFSFEGAYAIYNWELFFHVPLTLAIHLSKNQRFEEARDWYHFIFNPIGVESAAPGGAPLSKYWITKPFFQTTDPQYIQQRIDNVLRMLAGDINATGYSAQAKKDLEDQVLDWRTNPFEPHRIANYRTVAYQKTVVMKYLDNLIAWGDYLFRQDSMESINEATQLYILAAEILGPRPKKIPPQAKPPLQGRLVGRPILQNL
jgi:hypothetical protein